MAERPNADDLANKAERDLAYAWECADRLAEALEELIANRDANVHDGPEVQKEYQGVKFWSPAASMVDSEYVHAARQALAEYRKARG